MVWIGFRVSSATSRMFPNIFQLRDIGIHSHRATNFRCRNKVDALCRSRHQYLTDIFLHSQDVLFPHNADAIRHRPAETDPRRPESPRPPSTNEDSVLPCNARSCRPNHESKRASICSRGGQAIDEGGAEGGTKTGCWVLH
jgi:hypothetical protein